MGGNPFITFFYLNIAHLNARNKKKSFQGVLLNIISAETKQLVGQPYMSRTDVSIFSIFFTKIYKYSSFKA